MKTVPKIDPVYELEILRLASDGTGVGFIDGKTTFVIGMLPGEKGKVRIFEDKKTYQRAEVLEITEDSPERQMPPCTVYKDCGGCDLQHMNYAYSLYWKRQWVEDALTRIGGINNVTVEPVLGMEEPWRYRNKAVLHRDQNGQFGYYKQKTKDVVEFDDCLLLSKTTNARIQALRDKDGRATGTFSLAHALNNCSGWSTITFRESNRGKGLVLLEGNFKDREGLLQRIREIKKEELFSPHICSIVAAQGGRDFEGSGAPFLNEHIDTLRFRVSPRAFLQVNAAQTEKLYKLVFDWAALSGKEEVWDLYCGIGTMTLMLAKRCWRAVGIEENPHAVEDAIENAKDNSIKNVKFIHGKVEDKIRAVSRTPDVVVTDPPRAGMDPQVVQRLLQMKPKKIIYVSCNPATLARDLKALGCGSDDGCGGIYRVEKVQPVDMFAWAGHVECIILMTKCGSEGKK